ncbi:hypothetical protein HYH03_009312 [Edaphochlamys debaryana]|uniref:Uncharacterized protein n=1 Tax=Edaphochlamys debaryana TaxID=47281 RepID=A0A835Y7E5_9CHLO|nr:hypothetical protein HYH03_009312 [Edaphochlamys debaryana]|eukprot:KAG2492364.1 hypothetical protein HYH03_009312 [Edaphochlamys debaryana]
MPNSVASVWVEEQAVGMGVEVRETNSVFALFHTWFLPSAPVNTRSSRLRRHGWQSGQWHHAITTQGGCTPASRTSGCQTPGSVVAGPGRAGTGAACQTSGAAAATGAAAKAATSTSAGAHDTTHTADAVPPGGASAGPAAELPAAEAAAVSGPSGCTASADLPSFPAASLPPLAPFMPSAASCSPLRPGEDASQPQPRTCLPLPDTPCTSASASPAPAPAPSPARDRGAGADPVGAGTAAVCLAGRLAGAAGRRGGIGSAAEGRAAWVAACLAGAHGASGGDAEAEGEEEAPSEAGSRLSEVSTESVNPLAAAHAARVAFRALARVDEHPQGTPQRPGYDAAAAGAPARGNEAGAGVGQAPSPGPTSFFSPVSLPMPPRHSGQLLPAPRAEGGEACTDAGLTSADLGQSSTAQTPWWRLRGAAPPPSSPALPRGDTGPGPRPLTPPSPDSEPASASASCAPSRTPSHCTAASRSAASTRSGSAATSSSGTGSSVLSCCGQLTHTQLQLEGMTARHEALWRQHERLMAAQRAAEERCGALEAELLRREGAIEEQRRELAALRGQQRAGGRASAARALEAQG